MQDLLLVGRVEFNLLISEKKSKINFKIIGLMTRVSLVKDRMRSAAVVYNDYLTVILQRVTLGDCFPCFLYEILPYYLNR